MKNNPASPPYGIPYWYHSLANYTFITSFVKLNDAEKKAFVEKQHSGAAARSVIKKLSFPMKSIPGNCFVCVDSAAPTDTGRFNSKKGAVYSPESAWRVLTGSEKVRAAVSDGNAGYICIKPFRRITRAREFRLFIKDGKLAGMSQYWLYKHFKRLSSTKRYYLEKAERFVSETLWLLPAETLVMDVYFTSDGDIIVIDLNPWGEPSDPLLFINWDKGFDVSGDNRIKTVEPPVKISGEINVSF
jgi:hypothetical protein